MSRGLVPKHCRDFNTFSIHQNLPQIRSGFLQSDYNPVNFGVSNQLLNRDVQHMFHKKTKQYRSSGEKLRERCFFNQPPHIPKVEQEEL